LWKNFEQRILCWRKQSKKTFLGGGGIRRFLYPAGKYTANITNTELGKKPHAVYEISPYDFKFGV
jgi:hypothetical protein